VQLNQLILWWGLFLVSNGILGVAFGLLVKGGPFAKLRVPPMLSTFLMIIGLTMFLVAGRQNLLQATINFALGG